MSRVFVDANVVLEILLNRRLAQESISALGNVSDQYAISALTVHIIWYVAEKYNLDRDSVDDVLASWEVLPVSARTIKAARNRYDGKDFEDCLQAVCAEEGEYNRIITIDKHFQQYSATVLPVMILTLCAS